MMRLFVFLLILTQTRGDYPALKVQLLQKSLTDGSQMMSVWIQQKLKSTGIPDIHGNVDIGIGTIDYTLSNIWIRQSSMSGLVMEFVEGTGVSVMVSQLSLAVTGNWATHFGLIDDGGSFDLAVYNININLLLLFSDDESGRPLISTGSCTDGVGGVDMEFHGGASILFQPFVSEFRGQIKDMIQERICPAITQVTDDLEMHLQEMPVNLAVDQYIYLSIPLTSSPSVTNDNIQLDMKLASLYPDTEIQVLLYASETPMFSFNSEELDVHIPASAKFSAIKQDGSLVPLFVLDVDGFFSGNAQIENEHLTGALKMNNLTLNLGSSEIGDFKTAPLEQAIKIAMNMFVLPTLNEKLKAGFALPVLKDFSLINTNMIIKNGFVIILTDVEATPSNLSNLFWD
ncbi:bactericidal permeability-increasing protein-like isoform X2 [Paramisgurnus dabryanus]|uniref:bactericidal permeability-increasing protein-like isoform X2 n=1 Tax=Paramisgurnus dabryanus TaxID=90735 RepID=UPI0031F3BAB0